MKSYDTKKNNEEVVSLINSLMQPDWTARYGEWTDHDNKGSYIVFSNNDSVNAAFTLEWDKSRYQALTIDFIKESLDGVTKPDRGCKKAFAKAYEMHRLSEDLYTSLKANANQTKTAKLKV